MVERAEDTASASTALSGAQYFSDLADEGVLDLDLLRIHVGMVIQTRSADHAFDDTYKQHGFTNREFEVLVCNYAWGEKYKRPGDLARFLGMSPGGMTAVLDRLESRGLITRSVSGEDGRSRRIEPTDEGLRIVDFGLRVQLDWINENVGRVLDEGEQATYLRLLGKLLSASSPGYTHPPGD
ncbi:MAG: MarR family winged helix-turn-helix transcriptional regulator [Acidimicrobiia bacterium]